VKFRKYQALGNTYLVLLDGQEFSLEGPEISRVCDWRYGIGADGILLPGRRDNGFAIRIINPDGSEAEKSGNGLRIFSRYLWDTAQLDDEKFDIATAGGRVVSQVLEQGRSVEISMGRANFSSAAVPINVDTERTFNFPIEVRGIPLRINAVSMGNPHCVVFMDQVNPELAQSLGPELERHPLFPERTNVQFVRVIDRSNIQVEIWERGAGYTLSSGTSSCAAASVAHLHGFCDKAISVHMPGGIMQIGVGENFEILMRGPVQFIGTVELDPECLLMN
jgi:diaminopimelate epimerase